MPKKLEYFLSLVTVAAMLIVTLNVCLNHFRLLHWQKKYKELERKEIAGALH